MYIILIYLLLLLISINISMNSSIKLLFLPSIIFLFSDNPFIELNVILLLNSIEPFIIHDYW